MFLRSRLHSPRKEIPARQTTLTPDSHFCAPDCTDSRQRFVRSRLHRLQIENPAAATVRQTEWVFQIADREGGRGTHTLAAVVPFPYLCGGRTAPRHCLASRRAPGLAYIAVPCPTPPRPSPPRLQCSHAGAGIGSDVRSICLLFCYLLTDPVHNRINRFLLFLLMEWAFVISVIFVIFVNRFVIFVNNNLNLLFVNRLFCYFSFLLTGITIICLQIGNLLTEIRKNLLTDSVKKYLLTKD